MAVIQSLLRERSSASSSNRPKNVRAGVALVLRVNHHNFTTRVASVEELLTLEWFKNSYENERILEILFMLRPQRASDKFSGHVALPGGKQEPGETDQQTAERETLEEVGLDLSNRQLFQCLGRIPDHLSIGGTIIVSPFVFLQLHPIVPMQLNPNEVRAVRWAPIRLFLSHLNPSIKEFVVQSKELSLPLTLTQLVSGGIPHSNSLLSRFKVSLDYPNILLPYNSENNSEMDFPDLEFMLWGLSLRILMTMCAIVFQSKHRVMFPYAARSKTNILIDRLCRLDIWDLFVVYKQQVQQQKEKQGLFRRLLIAQFNYLTSITQQLIFPKSKL